LTISATGTSNSRHALRSASLQNAKGSHSPAALSGYVDLGLSITARAVNFGLEAERRYLAKRREGQPMQFATAFRLRHDQAPMLGPAPVPEGVLEASMRRAESTFCLQCWRQADRIV
jgi:hypothetical protein